MSKLRFNSYEDMTIEVLRATADPSKVVAYACALTQKKDIGDAPDRMAIDKLMHYLVWANHTSPFEHAVITVLIQGVSRSFLAQITRHRMGSFTSASQHYTRYDMFPNVAHDETLKHQPFKLFCDQADEIYNYLIDSGTPKEEARQCLPNAKGVNIMWTVNARSLINFFNQRLCKRNVQEMQVFARNMDIVCTSWFPELFHYVGPDCVTLGGCRQGKMKAKVCIKNGVPDFSR
jgi:thymidylate synthase (FAD)